MIRLLRAGEKMQSVFGSGHQAIEQRSVEAVQILERVGNSEAGTQVEMELGVADGSEIHQDHAAVGLLQGDGGVDGGGGRARASLGAEKGKDAGLARAAASAGAVGTETGQGFEKSFGAGAVIQIFTGPGAHAGHNGGGLLHGSVGKDGELEGVGLNQFDGFDGALRILGRDIDDDDFGAQVLNLAQDGIGGSGEESRRC